MTECFSLLAGKNCPLLCRAPIFIKKKDVGGKDGRGFFLCLVFPFSYLSVEHVSMLPSLVIELRVTIPLWKIFFRAFYSTWWTFSLSVLGEIASASY